jgi:hypothetical protein
LRLKRRRDRRSVSLREREREREKGGRVGATPSKAWPKKLGATPPMYHVD